MVNPLQAQTSVPLYSQSPPLACAGQVRYVFIKFGIRRAGWWRLEFHRFPETVCSESSLSVRSCTCVCSLGEYIKNTRSWHSAYFVCVCVCFRSVQNFLLIFCHFFITIKKNRSIQYELIEVFSMIFSHLSAIRPLSQLQGVRSVLCHWNRNNRF